MGYKPLFPVSSKSSSERPTKLEIGDFSTNRFVGLLKKLGIRGDVKVSPSPKPTSYPYNLTPILGRLYQEENVSSTASTRVIPSEGTRPYGKSSNFSDLVKAAKFVAPPKENAKVASEAQIGEVHNWASGPHKKVAPGKWVPVSEGHAKKVDPAKKTRPPQRVNSPDHKFGNDLDKRNPDGTVTVYYRTSAASARAILDRSDEYSREWGMAASTRNNMPSGPYSNHLVAIDIDPGFVEMIADYDSGEAHVSIEGVNHQKFKDLRLEEGGDLSEERSPPPPRRGAGDEFVDSILDTAKRVSEEEKEALGDAGGEPEERTKFSDELEAASFGEVLQKYQDRHSLKMEGYSKDFDLHLVDDPYQDALSKKAEEIELFTPALPTGYRADVEFVAENGNFSAYGKIFTDDGFETGTFSRHFSPSWQNQKPGISVYHSEFFIDGPDTGKGIGAAFLKDSLDKYESLGVTKIDVTPVQVGAYVWARSGFAWKNDSAKDKDKYVIKPLADEILYWANKKDPVVDREAESLRQQQYLDKLSPTPLKDDHVDMTYDEAHKIAKSHSDPHELSTLHVRGVNVGKEFLMDNSQVWRDMSGGTMDVGSKDFNNFKDYVGKRSVEFMGKAGKAGDKKNKKRVTLAEDLLSIIDSYGEPSHVTK